MFKKHQQTAVVLVVSILFFGIPFISAPESQSSSSFFSSYIFYKRIIETLFVVAYFYLNYFILVPYLYQRKKYAVYIVLSILCLMVVVQIPDIIVKNSAIYEAFLSETTPKRKPRPQPSFFMQLLTDRNAYLFYLALSIGILLRKSQLINEIKQDMLKSEVAYLKAQINPHFLFNTLNSLYALSLVKSDDAPDAILKLSSIMRYVVTESSKDKVGLKEELKYITDYLDLQKLRLTKNVIVDFKIEGLVRDQKIAPLLFISIIENCFKYGIDQNKESTITIHIKIDENKVTLNTHNKKLAKNINELEKTETGINNTRKKLNILYADKHKMHITDNSTDYQVKLTIEL